jgi:hypothetical protein
MTSIVSFASVSKHYRHGRELVTALSDSEFAEKDFAAIMEPSRLSGAPARSAT